MQEALIGARSIVSGQSEPPPCFGHSSRPWRRFGNKLAIERNDVSLIAGVGPTLQNEMHRAGFPTLDDVANSSIADLTTVRGIGPANGFRFRSKAQALTTGKPVRLGASFELPTNQIELFLDLEGDDVGPEPVSYLFGVAERVNSDVKYYPFLAKQPTEEGKQFRRFLKYYQSLGLPIIYHWHGYESRHIRRMLRKYRINKRLQEQILNNMVDLHPIATRAFSFPCHEDSLNRYFPDGIQCFHKHTILRQSRL